MPSMGSTMLCRVSSSGPNSKHPSLRNIPTDSPASLFSRAGYSPSLCRFAHSPTASESPLSLSQSPIDPKTFVHPSCTTPSKTYSADWNRFPQSKVTETRSGIRESFDESLKLKDDIVIIEEGASLPPIGRDSEKSFSAVHNDSEALGASLKDLSQPKSYQMSQISKRQFLRTKLCPFLNKGKCANGKNCSYAHANEQLRPLPDLRQTKLCDETKRGRPCKNPECTFAHTVYQLKPPTADLITYKTTMCFFWKKGKCFNGDKCRFAHGPHELRCFNLPKPPDRGTNAAPPELAEKTPIASDSVVSSVISSLGLEFVKTVLQRSSDKGDFIQQDAIKYLRQLVGQTFSLPNNNNNNTNGVKSKFPHDLVYEDKSVLNYQQQINSLLGASAAAEGSRININDSYRYFSKDVIPLQLLSSSPLTTTGSLLMQTSPYALDDLIGCSNVSGQNSSNDSFLPNFLPQQPTISIMAALESLLLGNQNC